MSSEYNKRVWLNPQSSYSTGNIVAFDGDVAFDGKTVKSTFLHISDCKEIIKLYKTDNDTMEDFIKKLETIVATVSEIKEYLKQKHWPAHLRDDAPMVVCCDCHRYSASAKAGDICGMIQPDSIMCEGAFYVPTTSNNN